MTTAKPPSEAASESSSVEAIIELTPNDVLLGRGTSIANYRGNIAFRAICDERKEEYTSIVQYKPKARIAKEILAKIHSLGGRFLKQVENANDEEGHLEDDVKWIEADEKTSLEKIKQALREHREKSDGSKQKKREEQVESMLDPNVAARFPSPTDGLASMMASLTGQPPPGDTFAGLLSTQGVATPLPSLGAPLVPSTINGNGTVPPVDTRLLLFQVMQQQQLAQQRLLQQQLVQEQQLYRLRYDMEALPGSPDALRESQGVLQDFYTRYLANGILNAHLQCVWRGQADPNTASVPAQVADNGERNLVQDTAITDSDNTTNDGSSSESENPELPEDDTSDKEDAVLALSYLTIADRPVFTKQQEELEEASMTDEERAAVLADTFGKMCKGSRPKNKKARRDLDRDSIDFLIKFMRHEIEAIPMAQKQALLEAQIKCPPEEFSDARLERFLRCDGMNAKVCTVSCRPCP